MHFFLNFPKITYKPKDGEPKEVVNILTSFFYRKMTFQRSMFFQYYTIKDEDTPESLSEEIYKNPLYYWSLLTINNIVDPYYEWVISDDVIDEFVEKKYRDGMRMKKKDRSYKTVPLSVGKTGIHHFYNNKTDTICDDYDDQLYRDLYVRDPQLIGDNIIPVTNLAFEKELNIKKRKIAIINPKMILKFEDDFKQMLNGETK